MDEILNFAKFAAYSAANFHQKCSKYCVKWAKFTLPFVLKPPIK